MILGKLFEKDKRKIKTLVESHSFDFLIMSLICLDALVLGIVASMPVTDYFSSVLLILDRLFMAIFIVEMLMKLYAYGLKFFKSGWNTFDFTVVAISSFSMFGFFIVLRAFRLFRLLKYVSRFSRLKRIINTFLLLLPNFAAMFLVFMVFFYIFSTMAVFMYGDIFKQFESLPASLFTMLQVFTLDGWAYIANSVMSVFPHAWVFFVTFLFVSFLVIVSVLMNIVSEIVEAAIGKKKTKSRL